jgi:hypothetical protein
LVWAYRLRPLALCFLRALSYLPIRFRHLLRPFKLCASAASFAIFIGSTLLCAGLTWDNRFWGRLISVSTVLAYRKDGVHHGHGLIDTLIAGFLRAFGIWQLQIFRTRMTAQLENRPRLCCTISIGLVFTRTRAPPFSFRLYRYQS